MPTRNVVLTDHQAALIERLVQSGRYQNASEVLRMGLRLLEHYESIEALEAAIAEAEAAYRRGDYTELTSEAAIDSFVRDLAPPG
jgi:antitoxin ParD1/3/4